MKIKTKVSFKEYAKLIYGLAYKKAILKLLIGVAILILLWIIFYYLHLFNLPKPIIYQYITLVLILIVQPTLLFITIRRSYYSSNNLQEASELEITPKEIKILGESYYMEVKWEKFFKIVETPNWFLLYQNSLSAIIIPKKDLDVNDMKDLMQILEEIKTIPVELLKI